MPSMFPKPVEFRVLLNLDTRSLLEVLCCASMFFAIAICLCALPSNESARVGFWATANAKILANDNSAENIKYAGNKASGFATVVS